MDEHKTKIREVFGNMSNEMQHNVWSELEHRGLTVFERIPEDMLRVGCEITTEELSKLRNEMCTMFICIFNNNVCKPVQFCSSFLGHPELLLLFVSGNGNTQANV